MAQNGCMSQDPSQKDWALVDRETDIYYSSSCAGNWHTLGVAPSQPLTVECFPDYESTFNLTYFIAAAILPRCVLVYGTVRIFIVVRRTHRQIIAQRQSISVAGSAAARSSMATAHAIRSSVNILVICVVSIVVTAPMFICQVIHNTTNMEFPDGFTFVALWLLHLNGISNSLIYLVMFRSVRRKTLKMLHDLVMYIRGREGDV